MQVLRTVVTSGSVTAAATALGYTPSAISQQVAALEKEAGTELLERVGRGVRPTAAGLLLTEYAGTIGRQVAEAEAALADLRAGRTGRLAVRYFATVGASLVAPAVARLRAEHPGVQVELKLIDPDDPLPAVKEGRADLALVVLPRGADPEGVRLLHLLDDTYFAVLPAAHPLADRPALELSDLADEPWVGSESPGPCLDAELDACAEAGFSPRFVVESEDYTTAQGFVAAGLGVGLIPRLGLGSPHPDVVVRRLAGREPHRSIHVAVRETAPPQPALTTFVKALREAADASGPRQTAPGPDATL